MSQTLKLTPKKSEITESFLKEKKLIRELIENKGSPLNVILPQNMSKNIEEFDKVIEQNNVNCKIFYAHKANRSKALVNQAESSGINIDVASTDELENALQAGFEPSRIEATGPKNTEFIDRLVEEEITINVDNFEELRYIGEKESKADVLIRVSGFSPKDRDSISKDSRFGIGIDRKEQIIEELKEHENIEFKGFAFHLSTSDIRKRKIAISNIFDLHREFTSKGLISEVMNIGGGFRTNYIKDREEWEKYISAIKKDVKENGDLTWKDENYGFYKDEDSVKGSNTFYNYFNTPSKEKYLEELLNTEIPGYSRKFRDLLQDFMLELYIEPGRALLDQAGLTLARVNFTKKSANNENLVGLDANKFDLYSTEQEMMLDPELISQKKNNPGEAFLVGNLCLESDVIYKHKTFFDQMPQRGDILAFINTAAYNMDFAENKSIHHSTSEKIAVVKQSKDFKIVKDEDYKRQK